MTPRQGVRLIVARDRSGFAVDSMILPSIFLAAENPVFVYFQRVFTADPFRGVYQVNSFDLLILIPYFVVLIILAFYGSHRYILLYKYHRNRGNRPPAPNGPLQP